VLNINLLEQLAFSNSVLRVYNEHSTPKFTTWMRKRRMG